MSALSRLREGDDRGATLLELLVGMSVMMIFLSIFTGAMLMMSKSESKARSTTDVANQLNQAFLWFDKNVRYAAAISPPGVAAGTQDWYVEFRNTTSGTEVCTQVRLDVASGKLQRRSWTVSGASYTGLSSWAQIANGFTNAAAAVGDDQPFYVNPRPSGSQIFQQLRVTLIAGGGAANLPTKSRSSYNLTAVNSTLPAPTTAICQEAGRP